jgi:uncharacterized membrane protein YadS
MAVVLALAATFVSEHYGGPQFLFALLFGMAFHFLATDPKMRPGIEFTARTVLRFGVGLLGVGITLGQVLALGAALVVAGGAVAICGASAALAISAVLPRSERSSQFTLLTVVGVTAFSTLAMIVYPAGVRALGFDDRAAGFFLGATIHDVAQVVGAGYMISPEAGVTATFVKLFRVAMLVPIVIGFSLFYRRRGGGSARPSAEVR